MRVSSRAKLVREHDGRGHQFRRFVAGVAKHQSLVAGALLGGVLAFGGRASTPCAMSGDCDVMAFMINTLSA